MEKRNLWTKEPILIGEKVVLMSNILARFIPVGTSGTVKAIDKNTEHDEINGQTLIRIDWHNPKENTTIHRLKHLKRLRG